MSALPSYKQPSLYPLRTFTLDEYHRMIDVGILGDEDRVELLNGLIVEISPIGRFHASCVSNLTNFFIPRLVGKYSCRQEQPITLFSGSEPEPDFVVAVYREDNYRDGHPTPGDILLLIEVADKTLERDRGIKAAIYADAGIPEYWVINLIDRRLEIYREPDVEKGAYAEISVLEEVDTLVHEFTGDIVVKNLLP